MATITLLIIFDGYRNLTLSIVSDRDAVNFEVLQDQRHAGRLLQCAERGGNRAVPVCSLAQLPTVGMTYTQRCRSDTTDIVESPATPISP